MQIKPQMAVDFALSITFSLSRLGTEAGKETNRLTNFLGPLGVGVRLKDADADQSDPIAYTAVKAARTAIRRDEDLRVLYVALTRARDRLLLTASEYPCETRACDFNRLDVHWEAVSAAEDDHLPPAPSLPDIASPDVVLV